MGCQGRSDNIFPPRNKQLGEFPSAFPLPRHGLFSKAIRGFRNKEFLFVCRKERTQTPQTHMFLPTKKRLRKNYFCTFTNCMRNSLKKHYFPEIWKAQNPNHYAAPIGAVFCPEIRAFTGRDSSKSLVTVRYCSKTKMAVNIH